MDTDGDGIVDREEFMLAARDALAAGGFNKEFRRHMYQFVTAMYDICDLDDDGVLNEAEVEFLGHISSSAMGQAMETNEVIIPSTDADSFGGEHVLQLLDMLDKDRDGLVSKEEFWRLARATMSQWAETVTRHDVFQEGVDALYDKADVSGDGLLKQRELQFASFALRHFVQQQLQHALLGNVDADGDGRIEWSELDAAVERAPEGQGRVLSIVADLFDSFDEDGDGVLSAAEAASLSIGVMDRRRKELSKS